MLEYCSNEESLIARSVATPYLGVMDEALARAHIGRQLASRGLPQALNNCLRATRLQTTPVNCQREQLQQAYRLARAVLAHNQGQGLVKLHHRRIVGAETPDALDEHLQIGLQLIELLQARCMLCISCNKRLPPYRWYTSWH